MFSAKVMWSSLDLVLSPHPVGPHSSVKIKLENLIKVTFFIILCFTNQRCRYMLSLKSPDIYFLFWHILVVHIFFCIVDKIEKYL